MTDTEKLAMLKANLQMLTSVNDQLLNFFLGAGRAAMAREGIVDDGSADYQVCEIDYAAYLFRKRAAENTGMPRFLRWQMNNLLMSQKMKAGDSSDV